MYLRPSASCSECCSEQKIPGHDSGRKYRAWGLHAFPTVLSDGVSTGSDSDRVDSSLRP
jgi:hypothetical protein